MKNADPQGIPLLGKAAVDATSKKYREASFDGADGGVAHKRCLGLRFFETRVCERPPRLRETKMLRDIFWIAQPPLLCKEGNVADPDPSHDFHS